MHHLHLHPALCNRLEELNLQPSLLCDKEETRE